jgi:hypothetical protein
MLRFRGVGLFVVADARCHPHRQLRVLAEQVKKKQTELN